MAVSWQVSSPVTYMLLIFQLLAIPHSVESLKISEKGRCALRCNNANSKQLGTDCLRSCLSVKKRSIDEEICDFEDINIYVADGVTPRGIAKVCVEYNLDNSGGYESVNVSWIVPKVPDRKNDSNKYDDVKGFFLQWAVGSEYGIKCRKLSKNISSFILNSSHLSPEKMKCDIPLSLVVAIVPIPGRGSADLQSYNCTKSFRTQQCFHWRYVSVPPTYETVSPTNESVTGTFSPETKTPKVKLKLPKVLEGKHDVKEDDSVCGTSTCQYAVFISIAAVFLFVLALIILLVKTKRLCQYGNDVTGKKFKRIFQKTSKDYCYVSYFCENGKIGANAKSVFDLLRANGVRTVAVNVLEKADYGLDKEALCTYYQLGPRKFSELYMHEARYVIVFVTKKYLELCDVNNNAELDGERRRVFEEIKYIDRAQLEFPTNVVLSNEKRGYVLPSSADIAMSFANNNNSKDKRFIAVILESSAFKLPTWMIGWPVFWWPKDQEALKQSLGVSI